MCSWDRRLHRYLSVEQEAHQAVAQLSHVFAGHPLDRFPPWRALPQLDLQQPFPLSPEFQGRGQDPEGLLRLPELQLQPAVHHHPRAVSIGVHRVCNQQQGLVTKLTTRF